MTTATEHAAKLDELLKYDSVAEAEKIIGHKGGQKVGEVGLMLQMIHNQKKDEVLKATKDSGFANKVEDYVAIIEDIGFKCVSRDVFMTKSKWESEDTPLRKEMWAIYFHPEYSIILFFDTYHGNINHCEFHYNYSIASDVKDDDITSSGHVYSNRDENRYTTLFDKDGAPYTEEEIGITKNQYKPFTDAYEKIEKINQDKWYEFRKSHNAETVWVGHHDGREAIRHKINKLVKNGRFQKKWIEMPWMWLLTHEDTQHEGYDYKKINNERFAFVPQWVKDQIGFNTIHQDLTK